MSYNHIAYITRAKAQPSKPQGSEQTEQRHTGNQGATWTLVPYCCQCVGQWRGGGGGGGGAQRAPVYKFTVKRMSRNSRIPVCNK